MQRPLTSCSIPGCNRLLSLDHHAGPFAVDASVFLNAFNPYEAGHDESHCLLAPLQAEAIPITLDRE